MNDEQIDDVIVIGLYKNVERKSSTLGRQTMHNPVF
jgi:hypothetical protein